MAVPWTVSVAAWQRPMGEPLGAEQAVQKALICQSWGCSSCLGRQHRAASPEPGAVALNSDFKNDFLCHVEPDSSSCKSGVCFCAPGEEQVLPDCSWREQLLQHSRANPRGLKYPDQKRLQPLSGKEILPSCTKVRKGSYVGIRVVLRSQGG